MKCKACNIFRILLLIYVALVAYLCFANFRSLPDVDKYIFGIPTDKVVHFCMFFPFAILGYYAYDRKTKTVLESLYAVINACAYGCIFAGITELIQATLPYRSEDLSDFGADCLGIGAASVMIFLINILLIKRKKK